MKLFRHFSGLSVLGLVLMLALSAAAQTKTSHNADKNKKAPEKSESAIPLPAPTVPAEAETTGESAEEDAILPYYDNYLKEYRLGPSDQISIEVFGQCPDYCKTGVTVP